MQPSISNWCDEKKRIEDRKYGDGASETELQPAEEVTHPNVLLLRDGHKSRE